ESCGAGLDRDLFHGDDRPVWLQHVDADPAQEAFGIAHAPGHAAGGAPIRGGAGGDAGVWLVVRSTQGTDLAHGHSADDCRGGICGQRPGRTTGVVLAGDVVPRGGGSVVFHTDILD